MTTAALFVLVLAICAGEPGSPTQTCINEVAPGQYDLQACHDHGTYHLAAGNAHAYVCRRAIQ